MVILFWLLKSFTALRSVKNSVDYIVRKAIEFKLGARGLRSICESILIDDMFNMPGSNKKSLFINKKYIEDKLDGLNFSGLKEAS